MLSPPLCDRLQCHGPVRIVWRFPSHTRTIWSRCSWAGLVPRATNFGPEFGRCWGVVQLWTMLVIGGSLVLLQGCTDANQSSEPATAGWPLPPAPATPTHNTGTGTSPIVSGRIADNGPSLKSVVESLSPWPRPYANAQATSASAFVGARRGRVRWRLPHQHGYETDTVEGPEDPHLGIGTRGDVYAVAPRKFRVLTARGKLRYERASSSHMGPAVLPNGDYILYDGTYHAQQVVRYRPDGRVVWKHPSPGTATLSTPLLLPNDRLLAVDLEDLELFDASGSDPPYRYLDWVWPSLKFKAPPVLHPDGTILLLTIWDGLVRMTPTGRLIEHINLAPPITPANQREASPPPVCSPDGSVYIVDVFSPNPNERIPHVRLRAVEAYRRTRWTWEGPHYCLRSAPALSQDGNTVYFPDTQGRLCALRARDGIARWRVKGIGRRGSNLTAPSLDVRGVAYCVDRINNTLLAISAAGKIEWWVRLQGRFPIRPIIGPSESVLVSTDRYLYCIE